MNILSNEQLTTFQVLEDGYMWVAVDARDFEFADTRGRQTTIVDNSKRNPQKKNADEPHSSNCSTHRRSKSCFNFGTRESRQRSNSLSQHRTSKPRGGDDISPSSRDRQCQSKRTRKRNSGRTNEAIPHENLGISSKSSHGVPRASLSTRLSQSAHVARRERFLASAARMPAPEPPTSKLDGVGRRLSKDRMARMSKSDHQRPNIAESHQLKKRLSSGSEGSSSSVTNGSNGRLAARLAGTSRRQHVRSMDDSSLVSDHNRRFTMARYVKDEKKAIDKQAATLARQSVLLPKRERRDISSNVISRRSHNHSGSSHSNATKRNKKLLHKSTRNSSSHELQRGSSDNSSSTAEVGPEISIDTDSNSDNSDNDDNNNRGFSSSDDYDLSDDLDSDGCIANKKSQTKNRHGNPKNKDSATAVAAATIKGTKAIKGVKAFTNKIRLSRRSRR